MAARQYDVIVLGGGISGLVCTWKLAQLGVKTLLIEREQLPGGVIRTRREGDWLMDIGPNSISFKEGDDVHQVIKDLDLEDELVSKYMHDSDRYIWRGDKLLRVPGGPMQLLRRSALSRRTLTRASWGMLRRHSIPDDDISVGAYFSHSLGRPLVDQLLSPALAGIYAADPYSLSLAAVMPRLHGAAKQSKSLVGALRKMKQEARKQQPGHRSAAPNPGRRKLCSFKNGMSTLPQRLKDKITAAGADVAVSCAVTGVGRAFEGGWLVSTSAGVQFQANEVVCTLPASAAADILDVALPQAAEGLRKIRYAPMMLVHVGVKEADVEVAHQGFGFLATRDAGVKSLGMIWSDRMFEGRAPQGHRLFTIFMGGQIDPGALNMSDGEALDLALRDLRRVMKWQGEAPEMARITRWQAAIPLLEVGHVGRVKAIENALPEGLTLSGNYVTGVSLPSCIQAGEALVHRLADKVKAGSRRREVIG